MSTRIIRSRSLALFALSCVAALSTFNSAVRAADEGRPIRALLVAGGCCHDYKHQKDILTKGISARANVQWKIAYDPDTSTKHVNPVYGSDDWAKGFDVVVHDECSSDIKDLKLIDRILKPHREGLPAVVLHCGMHSYRSKGWPNATPWFEFTGLPTTGHGKQLPIAVSYVDRNSPITANLADWTTIDEELYNNSAGHLLDTAHALRAASRGGTTTYASGRTTTPAKHGFSAPRWDTTTKRWPTTAISIS